MIPNKLYRGDSRGNKTLPEMYRSAGLISKLVNGGNPAYIDSVSLLEAVRAHVKPEKFCEQEFLNKSSFLSFSSKKEVALYYAASGKPEELQICQEEYFETKYLFTLNLSLCKIIELKEGVFKIQYECNPKLISPDTPSQFGLYLLRSFPCEFCRDGQSKHCILLVDVLTFLNINLNTLKNKDALINAQKDYEWLVIPADFKSELHGYSAKIPRSSIWQADHFVLKSEKPFKPEIYDFQELFKEF